MSTEYEPKCLNLEQKVNSNVGEFQIKGEGGKERFEAQKVYWNSLSDDQKDIIVQYKREAYQTFTPVSSQYLKMSPENRMKLGLDRTYETIEQNADKRVYTNSKRKNELLKKPDVLFALNNIVLDAPIAPSKPLTLYRGIAKRKYTEHIINMNVGDIFSVENVMSTTTNKTKLEEFASPMFAPNPADYLPLMIEFRLDASYPRYDLLYLEACVLSNREDEYLLPVLLKQSYPSDTSVYRNIKSEYSQAKWRCIEKKKKEIEFFGDRFDVDYLVMEPSYETNNKPITQRQLKKQAELNSLFMMPSMYRNTPMTRRQLQKEAQRNSNSAMATYMKNKDGGKRRKRRQTRKARK